MRPSTEALLVLLLFALFLKDCVLMLRAEEAVLVRGFGGRWRAGFGARSWRWAGREPYLANPLLPHEPVVRLRWSLVGSDAADAPAAARHRANATAAASSAAIEIPAEVVKLGPWAWGNWLLLFGLLPLALLTTLAPVSVLGAAALLYLAIAASLVAVWRARRAVGLAPKAFALLAFECFVCPPYSANLVRRVTAQLGIDADFAAAAAARLDAARLADVHRELRARIDERIEGEEPGSALVQRLERSRARFASEGVDEHE